MWNAMMQPSDEKTDITEKYICRFTLDLTNA